MGAYAISSYSIRITATNKCMLPVSLKLHLRNGTNFVTVPMLTHPILTCPCDFYGHYAVTFRNKAMEELLSKSQQTLPQAFLSRADKPAVKVPIQLLDARGPWKHKMAVCATPLSLAADWTLMVQFFEVEIKICHPEVPPKRSFLLIDLFQIWIAQGVTKFYIYIQSLAPEVFAVLKLYQQSGDVSVELISYALPETSKNANKIVSFLRIHRDERSLPVNDCLLRSRGNAKYTISADFEEVFVTFKNFTLFEMLEKQQGMSQKSGSYVIRSTSAYYEVGSSLFFFCYPSNYKYFEVNIYRY
ncbi:unnamed protein product [Gongylonema pulchrum]|uniref:Glycosyltransferase family 92 protein n=1 Tax=Gongylonema pulchrum TaxID=637853 RepID=A0A3P7NVI7_9BILA|nr:unnamed protein product [Gongylonema pulchrum]